MWRMNCCFGHKSPPGGSKESRLVQQHLKWLRLLLVVLIAGGGATSYLAGEEAKLAEERSAVRLPGKQSVYQVGLLQSDDTPEQDRMRAGLLAGLSARGFVPGVNITIAEANGGGSPDMLERQTETFLKGKKDLFITIGTEASRAMVKANSTIPVVAAGSVDMANDPVMKDRHNVTGVSDVPDMQDQLDEMARILSVKVLGVIFNSKEEASPARLAMLRRAAARRGMALYEVNAASPDEAAAKAKAMKGKVDAVFLMEDETVIRAFPAIMEALGKAGIPVIGEDETMVRRGALLSSSEDYYRMGFTAGLMTADILSAVSKPFQIPVFRDGETDLVVNMATARKMGIHLPGDVWQKARKLYLYDGQPARP